VVEVVRIVEGECLTQGRIKHFRPETERRIVERAGGSEMLEAAE
jgi:hypothetical protein